MVALKRLDSNNQAVLAREAEPNRCAVRPHGLAGRLKIGMLQEPAREGIISGQAISQHQAPMVIRVCRRGAIPLKVYQVRSREAIQQPYS